MVRGWEGHDGRGWREKDIILELDLELHEDIFSRAHDNMGAIDLGNYVISLDNYDIPVACVEGVGDDSEIAVEAGYYNASGIGPAQYPSSATYFK